MALIIIEPCQPSQGKNEKEINYSPFTSVVLRERTKLRQGPAATAAAADISGASQEFPDLISLLALEKPRLSFVGLSMKISNAFHQQKEEDDQYWWLLEQEVVDD